MNKNKKHNIHKGFKGEFKDLSHMLQGIEDKSRLKWHLASMEAKESWKQLLISINKLRRRIKILQNSASKEGDQARVQFELGLMEARDYWREMRNYFAPLKNDLKTEIDHARLQSHLASMDSKKTLSLRLKKIEHAYKQNLSPRINRAISELKKDFEKIDKNLSE